MIVRDLLVKLGFQANTSAITSADRQIGTLKASTMALTQVMTNLAQQGIALAVREMRESVDASIKFGREMGNISSLIDGNQERTKEFAQNLKQMGLESGKSLEELTGGLYDVLSYFGDSTEAIAQLKIATNAAIAGQATVKDALLVTGGVTKAYGDTSAAAQQHVADLAFTTVKLGKTNFPQLASAMASATPLAKKLGVSQEELFASGAALSGVTGDISMVMDQMRSAMRAVVHQSPQMKKAFDKAFRKEGITKIEQAIGKYGLNETLTKLIGTTDGSAKAVNELFGRIEGLQYALAITGTGAQSFKEKLDAMNHATGATDTALRAQTTGLAANAHALDLAKAKMEDQRVELGDRLAPAYIELITLAGEAAKLFGEQIVPLFTQVGAAMGDASDHGEMLHDVFKIIQFVVAGVSESLDLVLTQIKMVVLGIKTAWNAAKALKDNGDVGAVLRAGYEAEKSAALGLAGRSVDRGKLVLGMETGGQARERMARETENAAAVRERLSGAFSSLQSWAGQSVNTNVGGVTINVTVPQGTQASAAALIADTSAKSFMAQVVHGLQRGYPVQGPAPAQ